MGSRNPDFEGKKVKKVKKGSASKTRRSPKTATRETYALNPVSREFGAGNGWPVSDKYVKSGEVRGPKEGEVYLDGDGTGWFASFDFGSGKYEILVPAPKRRGSK